MAFSERELLARLIKCEAGGEGLNGMRAVATTVMNRVRVPYGEYRRVCRGNLRCVIEQPGQFACLMLTIGGKANYRNIWGANPEEIHFEVADWTLAGNRQLGVEQSLWYFNPYAPRCVQYFPTRAGIFKTRIVQHCYYDPTPFYRTT